jgi:hypothetical protein
MRIRGIGVIALLPLVLTGCGSSRPSSAIVAGGCSSLGATESITDRAGDPTPSVGQASVRAFRGVDLTKVTVGRSNKQLCVEFRADAPPAAGERLILDLWETRATGSSSPTLVRLILSSTAEGRWLTRLSYPGADAAYSGYVDNQLQASGADVAVTVDRNEFPSFAPLRTFRWDALAIAQDGPGLQVYDCAPTQADPVYPPGAAIRQPPARCSV